MSKIPFSTCAALLLAAVLGACSSSGGGSQSSAQTSTFRVTNLSVETNAVWQVNREIEIAFSLPVDFLTVASNTIDIRRVDGTPATGSFFLKPLDLDGDGEFETQDPTRVVFQPSCPLRADLLDAGFTPGGEFYTITIRGLSTGTNTIRSADGHSLSETVMRSFSTPASVNSGVVFVDTTPGAPTPIVRSLSASTTSGVSYVEIGGNADPASRIYFEFDVGSQTYTAAPGANAPSRVPLNLYSAEETSVAVVLEFNQSVNPSATNISSRRLRLEYESTSGATTQWTPIDTRVELVSNCTNSGATVRLEPIGLLPASSRLRAVVLPGFQDIRGEVTTAALNRFAIVDTAEIQHSTLLDPSAGADEIFEDFTFGAPSLQSFEDASAVFDTPIASWKNGSLVAAFDFDGSGGPGGDFDWIVRRGETFLFDTVRSDIVGGPNGVPTRVQQAVDGVVDVRNLVIEEGGELRVQGPNPLRVNATGFVRIDGRLNASGFNAKDVATLDTGSQPEVGGSGAASGGVGGAASERINSSTPRGGTGGGPYRETNTGGFGGESGYAPGNQSVNNRRPGGGGGGKFAADYSGLVGMEALAGLDGHASSTGAISGARPAPGGLPGVGPFRDATSDNDFFGVKPIVELDEFGVATLAGLVRGELPRIWAGYGGGGGGDALPSTRFPTPRWNATSDEKGGGGGGGGGAIRIRALGEIVFGRRGFIDAQGGQGATGENTNFLDHIGGSGGSGSGGHVVLESAVHIDFTDGDPATTPNKNFISTRGGPFTIGSKARAVPCGISHGGPGGPGVIQLHVPSIQPFSDELDPDSPTASNIIVPTAALTSSSAHPLDTLMRPPGIHMIPTFGARSKARSRWISLGGAASNPSGTPDLVTFLFGGTDVNPGPDEGRVLSSSGRVTDLAPLLGPEGLSSTVELLADGTTLRISGSSLDPLITPAAGSAANDVYLRTPTLLRNFLVRLSEVGNATNSIDFDVVSASYDGALGALELSVDPRIATLTEFATGIVVEYSLIPRFFQVSTDGFRDQVPDSTLVRITFEGARDDGFGNPDESNLLVKSTGDISEFNSLAPGDLQFFRFEVEFDLDATGQGIQPSTKPTQLDFLRIPFRF